MKLVRTTSIFAGLLFVVAAAPTTACGHPSSGDKTTNKVDPENKGTTTKKTVVKDKTKTLPSSPFPAPNSIVTPISMLNGDCSNGRPIGALANYYHRVRLRPSSLGFIRARSTPMWYSDDLSNVIGKLRPSEVVAAWGPLKNRPSHGIGYAVPLRDANGRTCRGYVSDTVLDVVSCADKQQRAKFRRFPKPIDVTPGPCAP